MVKHIFKVLILLIGVSTTVVGQVDTTATEKYLERNKRKSAFFGVHTPYAKGQIGVGHFTLKNGLVSSNIYSGNGIFASFDYGVMGEKYHAALVADFTYVNRLKPSFDYENLHVPAFNTLQFLRFGFPLSYERKIGKTNHFLGAYFALYSETVYNSRIEGSHADYPLGENYYYDVMKLFYFGPSYFYNHRILGMPVSLYATLSIPISIEINDVKYTSTRYTFEYNLSVYRNTNVDIQVSYNWNYTNLGIEQNLIHQYKVGGNSVLLTILF